MHFGREDVMPLNKFNLPTNVFSVLFRKKYVVCLYFILFKFLDVSPVYFLPLLLQSTV